MEDMRNLEAFAAVARAGSFTAAAAELGLTTAAVSKIVSRLEGRLGTRLFMRSTRRLSLTADGRVFLDKVSLALAHVHEAVDMLREARHQPSGTVRLWTNSAIGKDHVLPMLPEFLDRYPGISVDVRFDDSIPNLAASGYDLAIHHTAIGGGGNDVAKLLAELPLVLVASKEVSVTSRSAGIAGGPQPPPMHRNSFGSRSFDTLGVSAAGCRRQRGTHRLRAERSRSDFRTI